MTTPHTTHEQQRTLSTGYRGSARVHSLDDLTDKAGIGIWVSDSICWAQRYAERKAVHIGGAPHVQEVAYALVNPLGLGDTEEPATDDSLQELAHASGLLFGTLSELRHAAGWNGEELDEPCLFEITNTPGFVALAKAQGYDGMIGWENGDSYQVTCIFDKRCIDSVKDITDTIPEGWWSAGEEGRNVCQSV